MVSRAPMTLSTDFGLRDPYSGIMKGVIASSPGRLWLFSGAPVILRSRFGMGTLTSCWASVVGSP